MSVSGKRVLVIGASAGLGKETALQLVKAGAKVSMAARRQEVLDGLVKEAGGGSIAVQCDVRDERSCEQAVARTAKLFGGLDALVYSTGGARPVLLADATAEQWRWSLDTNLIGASLVTKAALPHLQASFGRVVYFGSISANDQVPRKAMAPYVVSKAALNTLIEAWRGEHPEIAFTRFQIGDTLGTDFGLGWSAEEMSYVKDWAEAGLLFDRVMKPSDVAETTVQILGAREDITSMTLQPRRVVE